jgi:anti-sigma B factor antagonist
MTSMQHDGLAEHARSLSPEIGTVVRDRRRLLVALRGELDAAAAPALQAAIDALIDENVDRVIFDLAQLRFIDSSGLNVLLTVRELLGATAQPVIVRNASPIVRRVLEVTGLSSELTET